MPSTPDQCARLLTHIHRVDHQEPLEPRDVRKQAQSLRSAVHQHDVRRNSRVDLQALDCVNAHAVIGVDQISEPQY